jgi:hypothetical protein
MVNASSLFTEQEMNKNVDIVIANFLKKFFVKRLLFIGSFFLFGFKKSTYNKSAVDLLYVSTPRYRNVEPLGGLQKGCEIHR